MGQITVNNQTFNIKGDQPTLKEEEAIQQFFVKKDKSESAESGQSLSNLSIEEILEKGAVDDKDTMDYVKSPEFGRLVTELLLSIGGSVAAAYVPGGQVALPLMLARVARYSKPLITAAKTAIGAGVGGGTGAAISQTFDPKEDIVKEVTRAAAEGSIGDVLGRGAGKVLGGIYNKVVGKGTDTIKGARAAARVIEDQKNIIRDTIQKQSSGAKLDDVMQARLSRIEQVYGPQFAQTFEKALLTPGLAANNRTINLLENIAEGSFLGSGSLVTAKEGAEQVVRSAIDDFVTKSQVVGKDIVTDQNIMGKLLKESLTQQDNTFRAAMRGQYKKIDDMLKTNLGTDNVVDVEPLKMLAMKNMDELRAGGMTQGEGPLQVWNRALNLAVDENNKTSFSNLNKLRKIIAGQSRSVTDTTANETREAVISMKRAIDETLLGKTLGRESVFKEQLGDTFRGFRSKVPETLRAEVNKVNSEYFKGLQNFNNKVIASIIEKSPDDAYKFIVGSGKQKETVKELFNALDNVYKQTPGGAERAKGLIRAEYINQLFNASKKDFGQFGVYPDATKLSANLGKTKLVRDALFDDKASQELVKNIEQYKNALNFTQGKLAKGALPGKIFIQLKQAAYLGQIPLAITAGYFDNPGAAATILLGPMVVAKMFTNPKIAKLLIDGAKPQNFEKSGRIFGQILQKLEDDGEISETEKKAYMEEFQGLKTTKNTPQPIEPVRNFQALEQETQMPAGIPRGEPTIQTTPVQTSQMQQPINTQVTDPLANREQRAQQAQALFPFDADLQQIARRT